MENLTRLLPMVICLALSLFSLNSQACGGYYSDSCGINQCDSPCNAVREGAWYSAPPDYAWPTLPTYENLRCQYSNDCGPGYYCSIRPSDLYGSCVR